MDITELVEKRDTIMRMVTGLSDDQLESKRKQLVSVITSSSSSELETEERGYYLNRVKGAETVDEVKDTLRGYFTRAVNARVISQRKNNPLIDILDMTTGSPADGTHMRDIYVSIEDNNNIKIRNSYQGHSLAKLVTTEQFVKHLQDPVLPYSYYYKDFIDACQQDVRLTNLLERAEREKNKPATRKRMQSFRQFLNRKR